MCNSNKRNEIFFFSNNLAHLGDAACLYGCRSVRVHWPTTFTYCCNYVILVYIQRVFHLQHVNIHAVAVNLIPLVQLAFWNVHIARAVIVTAPWILAFIISTLVFFSFLLLFIFSQSLFSTWFCKCCAYVLCFNNNHRKPHSYIWCAHRTQPNCIITIMRLVFSLQTFFSTFCVFFLFVSTFFQSFLFTLAYVFQWMETNENHNKTATTIFTSSQQMNICFVNKSCDRSSANSN